MSTKQLARTVLDGRLLTFRLDPTATVEGYLCGMDDFHWMVVDHEGQTYLLHKGSVSLISFGEAVYRDEPRRHQLERIVRPFREFITREVFGREDSPSASGERVAS